MREESLEQEEPRDVLGTKRRTVGVAPKLAEEDGGDASGDLVSPSALAPLNYSSLSTALNPVLAERAPRLAHSGARTTARDTTRSPMGRWPTKARLRGWGTENEQTPGTVINSGFRVVASRFVWRGSRVFRHP